MLQFPLWKRLAILLVCLAGLATATKASARYRFGPSAARPSASSAAVRARPRTRLQPARSRAIRAVRS